jgi:AraC-like DNA-binding protein
MFDSVDDFETVLSTSGLAPVHNVRPVGGRFRADVRTGGLGRLRVIQLVTPEGECRREARHAGPNDDRYWQVDLMLRGRARVEQAGRSVVLGPADLSVIDPARPVRIASSAAAHVSVLIPREDLRLGAADSARLLGTRIPTGDGPGALVGSVIRGLAGSRTEVDPCSADRSAAAVIELISVALDAQLGLSRSTPDDALRHRIVGYVEARLSDADLCPAKVAAVHHVSTRRVHRLFEDQPLTLAALIRSRRLERCHVDLSRGDLPVGAVAARWGFSDVAHFSRLFKRAYGYNAVALTSKNPARMINAPLTASANDESHDAAATERS